MKSVLVTVLAFAALSLLSGCGSKQGPVVAKVKGLKIHQAQLDSLFPEVRDKAQRADRLKEHLKSQLDDQVLYLKALKMGFHRQKENRAILRNIDVIEASNYYYTDIIQKNWGYLESDVEKRFRRDRDLYKREKPKTDSVPTADQKKAVAEWEKDPVKPLDQARSQVLRTLLMDEPENKKQLDELIKGMKGKVDSGAILAKQDEIINAHVTDLDQRIYERLMKQHNVKITPYIPKISDADLKAEWEKTKANFRRQPDLTVQHIEVAKDDLAKKIISEVNDKNKDFLALQKKHSINKETVGKDLTVYANADIPGLPGDTRSIYPKLTYVAEGKACTPPIELRYSPERATFHIFKLVKREPESIKTFEEATPEVRQSLYAQRQLQIPDTATLATLDGRAVTAAELFTLLYKMSPMVTERYKNEEGRKTLLERYYLRFLLYDKLAREKGLNRAKALKDRIEKSKRAFLTADFRQTYLDIYYGLSEAEARKYHKANPDTFREPSNKDKVRPFDECRIEVVNHVLVTPKMVDGYYQANMEDFAEADGAPKALKDVAQNIFYTLLAKEKERRTQEALRRYRREFGLKIYNKELDYTAVESPDQLFERTKKLHEERKYTEALNNYQTLRYQYPQFKGHPDICMAVAQIYIEQNQFHKAIQEYKRYLRLYADRPDKYKAQFMIGFVYSENLKDKDKAISNYQSVLDNYPKCDLVESAKFMIDHLKSGKDEFFFADSGAVDTTAAVESAPAAPAPTPAPKPAAKK